MASRANYYVVLLGCALLCTAALLRPGGAILAAEGASPNPAVTSNFPVASDARLAAYKVPKTVEFVDQIPKNAYGKVSKRQLREERSKA